MLSIAVAILATQGAPEPPKFEAFVTRYCVRCHSDKRSRGEINLEVALRAPHDHARLLRRAQTVVEDSIMPPASTRRQPEVAERTKFRSDVEAVLRDWPFERGRDPGRVTLRRLTRVQYRHVIRDLVGVDIPIQRLFPEDARSHGFDTVGDVQFVTPAMIEKYRDVTDQIIDRVFGSKELLAGVLPRRPEDAGPDAARENLRGLMRRAFRRPPTEAELDLRVALARDDDWLTGMQRALRSVLLSPHFLFRVESDRSGDSWQIDEYELASRLSFFLWARGPDRELRELADAGRLRDELDAQVGRMLADPRSRSLAEDFSAQWLGFRDILTLARDIRRFRPFHRNGIREAMFGEAVGSFDRIVREDRSVLELIDSDWVYVNQALARHYGIEGVKGPKLRVVEIDERRRGGVLGWGAILTTTSYPLRTSPVVRGKWLLETLLNAPPPPPPPDAGDLPSDDKQDDGLTLRQRLERHRADRRCASCHARMDPFGFALEPYDAIGQWRTAEHGQPVDAASELPGGATLDGPVALKDWLLARRDRFVRALAEKLMTYALGRPIESHDEPAVTRVVDATQDADQRLGAMVLAIVRSYPFQHRRSSR